MGRKQEEERRNSPATPSRAYEVMSPMWEKISTVLGDTDAMIAAGRKYLPQHPLEDDDVYAERLNTNVLKNYSEDTLEAWVGKPFSKPIALSEDMPDEIKALMDDVDMLGNNLDVFCREWFSEGMAKAFAHVLVDFTDPGEEEGEVRSRRDDQEDGVRPYWVLTPPESLFHARREIRRGREVITHARIFVTDLVPDGFDEEEVHRIKIWDAGYVERESGEFISGEITTYTWKKEKKSNKEAWVVTDRQEFPLDFVPIATFYADRQDFMKGKPPLLQTVNINITHWQSSSDQRSSLTVARFPLLAGSGVEQDPKTKGKKRKIGPRTFLLSRDPRGKHYWVEHQGHALGAGREDLKDLEDAMSHHRADALRKKPGDKTATGRVLDAAEAASPLQAKVLVFEDAINLALEYTRIWMEKGGTILNKAGKVSVNREFLPQEEDSSKVAELREARKGRDLCREFYLDGLSEFGVLPKTFDPDKNKAELDKEDMDPSGAADTDIDPDAEE